MVLKTHSHRDGVRPGMGAEWSWLRPLSQRVPLCSPLPFPAGLFDTVLHAGGRGAPVSFVTPHMCESFFHRAGLDSRCFLGMAGPDAVRRTCIFWWIFLAWVTLIDGIYQTMITPGCALVAQEAHLCAGHVLSFLNEALCSCCLQEFGNSTGVIWLWPVRGQRLVGFYNFYSVGNANHLFF